MAPQEKTKTMALEYEQQRLHNMKRNKEMIAAILHKKSQLASVLSSPKEKKSKPAYKNRGLHPPMLRQSLRLRGLPPVESTVISKSTSPPQEAPTGRFSFTDSSVNSDSYRSLVKALCWSVEREESGDLEKEIGSSSDGRVELGLKENKVAKVVRVYITDVRFLPVPSRSIVISGNMQGYLGLWDADHSREDGDGDSDGVFLFYPHRSRVSGISVRPSSVRKVKSLDQRTGEISNKWEMHEERVNSIDFHPENANLIATSSSDRFVRIWDLRYISKDKPKSMKEVAHSRLVNSAYFSPSGNGIVSTCFDDTVRIMSGPQYEKLSIIKHYNGNGCCVLAFRATWGWNDSYIFIGNTKTAIDVISTDDNIITPLKSEHMTHIPCRFATHPYKEGHLACAGSGKLYLWTK